ncbi:MAG: AMP-binding protein, partial [Cyanobacteria bacterium J06649_11]
MQPKEALDLASVLKNRADCCQGSVAISFWKGLANAQTRTEPFTSSERLSLSYQALYQHIVTVVGQLRALNIQHHDRVAVALPNGPEAATAFLSIASGATCAPLNPNYRASEYEFYLNDLEAKALILQPGVAEPARTV